MDFSAIDIISIALYIVFESFTIVVFQYQRTIRMLGFSSGADPSSLGILYPRNLMIIHYVSYLKWLFLGRLVVFHWITAISLFTFMWILSVMIPDNHKKNLIRMRNHIKNPEAYIPSDARKSLLGLVDHLLSEMGYDTSWDDGRDALADFARRNGLKA